jgi:plasmid stabilization system protein ParE
VQFNFAGEDKAKPDWRMLKDFLLREGPIRKDQVTRLLKEGIALLSTFLHP